MKSYEIYLLRESGSNGLHKAIALEDIVEVPVINTPVHVTEPNHPNPKTLIKAKYLALSAAYEGTGIRAVADLVTSIDGMLVRKPPTHLAPHQLSPHLVKASSHNPNPISKFTEHSAFAIGKSTSKSGPPTVGIATLQARLPTRLLADTSFLQDHQEASGLGMKIASVPGGIDLATFIALVLQLRTYKSSRLRDFIIPPDGFSPFISNNPGYVMQRMQLFEELGRLNQTILHMLPPHGIVMLLDSALNMSGHMIKPLWQKFTKQTI